MAVFAVFAVATYKLHASAAQLSLIMVAYMLPMAVVSPLSGALVDRWNLKRAMVTSDLLRAGLASLLLVATDVHHVYAILFALSTVSSVFYPAQAVMLRRVVPGHGLMAANALMAQVMQVTMIVSPAVSGAIVGSFGPKACFWFDVATFLFSAAAISGICVSGGRAPQSRTFETFFGELTGGLRFIFTHADISFVMVAMTLAMFAVRCFAALMAVWARDVLHVGPALYGALTSSTGVGMICATQFVLRFGAKHSKPHMVVFGLASAGAFVLLVAALPSAATTALGLFGMGFGIAFVFIPAQTLFQQATPIDMLGRVSSAMTSSLAMIQVIALLLSGSIAEVVGIRAVYAGSSVLLVTVAMVGFGRLGRGARSRRAPQ